LCRRLLILGLLAAMATAAQQARLVAMLLTSTPTPEYQRTVATLVLQSLREGMVGERVAGKRPRLVRDGLVAFQTDDDGGYAIWKGHR
jgi:hypothetical protein